jgi:hypothetical protein
MSLEHTVITCVFKLYLHALKTDNSLINWVRDKFSIPTWRKFLSIFQYLEEKSKQEKELGPSN